MTCQYQQEVLDESIGACTSDLAVCIYTHNGKGITSATKPCYFTKYVLRFVCLGRY